MKEISFLQGIRAVPDQKGDIFQLTEAGKYTQVFAIYVGEKNSDNPRSWQYFYFRIDVEPDALVKNYIDELEHCKDELLKLLYKTYPNGIENLEVKA